jgi:hypothetical protein
MADDEPELIYSPLERKIVQGDIFVTIKIYRAETETEWLLEVEDHLGGSTVWDGQFATDKEALDEALRVLDEEGIESFTASSSAFYKWERRQSAGQASRSEAEKPTGICGNLPLIACWRWKWRRAVLRQRPLR